MKMLVALFLLMVSVSSFATKETPIKEYDIIKCEKDSDCVVVPYKSCCGSTKKAINKMHLRLYNKTPAWQKFDNPGTCALIGACMSDEKVKEAKCSSGLCSLRFPEN